MTQRKAIAQKNAYLAILMYLGLHSYNKGQDKTYSSIEERQRTNRLSLETLSYNAGSVCLESETYCYQCMTVIRLDKHEESSVD